MHKRDQEAFSDIPGKQVIADMIIAAETVEEHDQILHKVMQRARKQVQQFNRTKVQFQVTKVLYMGNIITPEGPTPDKSKIRAIADIPSPEDKPALQHLLGMVKYRAQNIPNESETKAPLCALLKKDAAWSWEVEHTQSLNKVKAALATEPVLRYYNVSKPVTIQADASQSGFGCCLLQEGRPVHYASRSMRDTEKK